MPSFVGGAQAKDVSSLHLPSSSSCRPLTLKFVDVSYRVKVTNKSGNTIGRIFGCGSGDGAAPSVQERSILHGVSGMVSPGETLAILGPSGSGKSTLLNALAGRFQGDGLTGSVLANGQKLSKSILRWTGFVTQDDVLYPHLTVRETLIFCSLLRLPLSLSKQDKVAVAESVIVELGLTKCQNTIIGNAFIRGVSGGERKRVSIGHEMLINPSLLILDEPTSGLDSTAAHRLVTTMAALAHKGKTIVTSIHQPSSRVYQTFDKVLVLSEGRCLYYGKGSEAMSYFESIGFTPSFPMNPADFLLDLANGVYQVENTSEGEKPNMKQTLITSYNTLLAPRVKAACMETSTLLETKTRERLTCKTSLLMWCNQLSILLQRNLKERKHETFNGLRVFQVITAAMLAGLMWWHSDFRDIQDRLGLLFFISIFWGVFPSFNAVFAFPQERAIFLKERASGLYTLSSYFMARVIGDLPMELILPTIFLTIAYWMTELKPELGAFLLTLSVLLGYVLVSQGLGLALGATIMDAKQASTVVTVTMLAFVLTGGFYVHKVPTCMTWIKYISATYYSYRLFINVQYGTGDKIWSLLGCSRHGTDKARCNFVEEDVVGQISPELSIGALLFMFVGYRLLAYLALRRIK
ncbi:ABC transporter G family member 25-like [Cucurbita moschata]|uniref:ABC transporter G family member 25-like n=1 Tax=Cucurbita moschata TaxID=3662 RepID=A0A6J1F797_CUCMO|nr:ABC transporter G family member 25-like [Cucurbita moschata]